MDLAITAGYRTGDDALFKKKQKNDAGCPARSIDTARGSPRHTAPLEAGRPHHRPSLGVERRRWGGKGQHGGEELREREMGFFLKSPMP